MDVNNVGLDKVQREEGWARIYVHSKYMDAARGKSPCAPPPHQVQSHELMNTMYTASEMHTHTQQI